MINEDKIFEEALDVITEGKDEISITKKIVVDKKNGQVSIKIPKDLAIKKLINENTQVEIVFNPKKEAIEKAEKSGFIIFIKEVNNGKGEKRT